MSDAKDNNLDPVAQALENIRRAGGKPQGNLPRVASKKRMRDAQGKTTARVFKQPTGLDGRAINNRSEKSYRSPKEFHQLVRSTIGRFGWAEDFAIGSVMNNWSEIVGPTLGECTWPVEFHKTKRELVVQCDATSWATQLRFMKPNILEAIARLAGEEIVKDLDIRAPDLAPKQKGRYRVQGRGPREDYG